MLRTTIGFALAFSIGAACRITEIPVPAPAAVFGALLVLAMTVGYLVTGRYADRRALRRDAASGGPTGVPPSDER